MHQACAIQGWFELQNILHRTLGTYVIVVNRKALDYNGKLAKFNKGPWIFQFPITFFKVFNYVIRTYREKLICFNFKSNKRKIELIKVCNN